MKNWNGEWWAESFEDDQEYKQRYADLLKRFESKPLTHKIAREFFQLGHEHGYELASDLSYE